LEAADSAASPRRLVPAPCQRGRPASAGAATHGGCPGISVGPVEAGACSGIDAALGFGRRVFDSPGFGQPRDNSPRCEPRASTRHRLAQKATRVRSCFGETPNDFGQSPAERGMVREGRRMRIEVVQSWKNLEEDCVERRGGWSPSTAGAFPSTGECHCGRDASPTGMTDESAGSTGKTRADSPVAGRHREARKCRGKSA
jgi:hypothetical protein